MSPSTNTATRKSLRSTAESLLAMAEKAGAQHAEVYGYGGTSLSAKMEKGDLGQVQADEGASLGLRVILDGRLGFASTNQSDAEALGRVASDAVAIARLSPADESNVLAAPKAADSSLHLAHRMDPALASLGVAEVVERARALAADTVAHDPRISVDQASFSAVTGESIVLSTSGVDASDRDAALTLSLMALAIEGDETGGFDYRGSVVRDLANVDAESTRLAGDVARAALGNLGARPGESYTGPVLFAPEAFATAFLSPLLSGVSSMAVQRGRSALAEKLGESIAPGLSLVDDPTDRAAAGARAFDREGSPTSRFPIIEDGILRSFLHNAYTAAVGGAQTTGHAQGGPRSVPMLGAHAVQVLASAESAPKDEAALLRALGNGLYVQRISGSVDGASGDFSGAAKSARWVKDGEITHSVNEIMLSGNAYELLKAGLTYSKAQRRLSGSSLVPWALAPEIPVTAG